MHYPNETTVHDYEHWNEDAARVQAAERSVYDGEYSDEDFYGDDY